MVLRILRHVRYFVRPSSDHTEVCFNFERISREPLTSHLGYMPSRGTICGLPHTFVFAVCYSLPSAGSLRPIMRHNLVCPFLLVFGGNAKPRFQKRWFFQIFLSTSTTSVYSNDGGPPKLPPQGFR